MSAKLVASAYENVLSVYCEMIETALASSSAVIRSTGHALFVNQFSRQLRAQPRQQKRVTFRDDEICQQRFGTRFSQVIELGFRRGVPLVATID